ncbi:hypothetical protein Tco_1309751 [Tanacetum coccineum]
MFTRSLVIQKRVKDLQLGVESYQKHINVTKPDTTRPDLKKRHPYTPYKDPQRFIYVDEFKRNRLMHSEKLYKFNDGTLTRLLSLLEDITKNIDIEYLPKRRWSTLEKKRAHFMIKDINKLLKERRMMRSLEKFIWRKILYGTTFLTDCIFKDGDKEVSIPDLNHADKLLKKRTQYKAVHTDGDEYGLVTGSRENFDPSALSSDPLGALSNAFNGLLPLNKVSIFFNCC